MDDNNYIYRYGSSNRYYKNQRQRNNPNSNQKQKYIAEAGKKHNNNINKQLLNYIHDLLPTIKLLIEQATNSQKYTIKHMEKLSKIEEQKGKALFNISKLLINSFKKYKLEKTITEISSLLLKKNEINNTVINRSKGLTDRDTAHEDSNNMASNNTSIETEKNSELIADSTLKKKNVLKEISMLRSSGKSFVCIARLLEKKNIPTFSGKGKWHGSTVANLIKKTQL